MKWPQAAYRFYRERTAVVIILFFVIGGAVTASSTAVQGVWNAIVMSLGISLLSLGAFSATSEYFLKTALTDDILAKIQLQAEVANSGFAWVRPQREVSWSAILSEAHEIDIVVTSPEAFQQSIWPHLLAVAKSHPVRAQVILSAASINSPAQTGSLPEVPVVDNVRQVQQPVISPQATPSPPPMPPAAMKAEPDPPEGINLCAKHIEEVWRSAKAGKALSARCELRIAYLQSRADCGLVRADDTYLILLSAPHASHEDAVAAMFTGGTGSHAVGWVVSTLKAHTSAAEDLWSDLKKKGAL